MLKQRYVVVDIETTGHSVEKGDRIIQIGAVAIENGEIVERLSTFVNPEQPIPQFIQGLTGISEHMVINAPSFAEVVPELLSMLEGSVFVAHNVAFDLSFLQKQLELVNLSLFEGQFIDTVELARLLLPSQNGYKLNELATSLNITHERPHQADSDAEVTGEILLFFLEKLQSLPLLTLQQLEPLTSYLISDIEDIVISIIRDKLTKTETNDEIEHYRQLAFRKPFEVKREHVETTDDFETYQSQIFGEEGSLAKAFGSYERRDGQEEMSEMVAEALRERQHLLIEAGTGTGKSLAYLLPAAFFSKQEKQSVIISTKTIPLQQQLLERDIPLLKKVAPFNVTASLLKGRNHYLCLRKFEQSLADHTNDNYDTILSKGQILVWLTETTHGDVEELNLPSGGRNYWHQVKSDASTCLGRNCPWITKCFYQRARRNAEQSDLIITNHALVMTDLAQGHSILPKYSFAVIDEAHHFEESASDHLGLHSDYVSFSHLLNRIGKSSSGDSLNRVKDLFIKYSVQKNETMFHKIDEKLDEVRVELDELFRMIRSYVLNKRNISKTEVGRISYRFNSHEEEDPLWQAILECSYRTIMICKDFSLLVKSMLAEAELFKERSSIKEKGFLTSLSGMVDQVYEERDKLEQLLLEHDPESVYWVEVDSKGARNATYLYSKPVDVSEILADQFFSNKKSVVLTSATLTIKGSFSYLIDRLGLEDFGPMTKMIDSPFDYEKQAKLYIPQDVLNIKEVDDSVFIEDIVHKIKKVAVITNGRMLVLFTSFDMLKQAYYLLKSLLQEDEEFILIGQGINSSSRAKLMKTFKQHEKSILFGTSTFWEGIDLPGEDLSCLVIVRLPFSPPDQPLIEAKSEMLKEQGKNPFMALSLPQAILRFKQGFGRLIRTENDRGVVIVLDKRIITTRYGSSFIKSLPPLQVQEGTMNNLIEDIKDWL
ncbi:ATP-dependent DNA helicase DinG [Bacillus sp. FJAT-45350]|uniref:ATP-dependent DNA helicase DinG n=1 Tax=Bacillus sp. FJAT-45350 TaxID=2011014 RepID=UPI000BB93842|nr:ATP-dependent DNA helicase DinG [Bacillus sp. FJAT-45350]